MRPEKKTNRGRLPGWPDPSSSLSCLWPRWSWRLSAAQADDPCFARMETDEGDILLVFYPELAPHHVDNFVHLSRTGFYDGTKFHRIVPGFVIQGGDPNSKDADPAQRRHGRPDHDRRADAEELEAGRSRSTRCSRPRATPGSTARPISRPSSPRRSSTCGAP